MNRPADISRFLIAALLLAVFVIMPVADAFACAGEPVDSHAASVLDDHGDDGLDHEACQHGHCHHASTGAPPIASAGFGFLDALVPLPLGYDRLVSRAPDGLMRPPRA